MAGWPIERPASAPSVQQAMRAQVDAAAVSSPLLHSGGRARNQNGWLIGPTDREGKKTEEGGRKLARTTTVLIGAAITKYG